MSVDDIFSTTKRWIEGIRQDWNLLTNERPLKRAEEFAFAISAATDCIQLHGRRGNCRVTGSLTIRLGATTTGNFRSLRTTSVVSIPPIEGEWERPCDSDDGIEVDYLCRGW
ncbi:hypothetical protein QTP88_020216 [Uroleucon formosanum]